MVESGGRVSEWSGSGQKRSGGREDGMEGNGMEGSERNMIK